MGDAEKIILILRPEGVFDLPISEGYQLYSALLAAMEKADSAAAKRAHDSPIGPISLGRLEGRFGRCADQRARHKSVDPAEKYRLSLGITDPKEAEIFRSIIQPLVLREQNLIHGGGRNAPENPLGIETFQKHSRNIPSFSLPERPQ